jgi:hypothetical protein
MEALMSSPWEPAISQAMQRHGGSNRSIPKKAQSRPSVSVVPGELPAPETQEEAQNDVGAFVKPEKPAA